MSEYECRYLFAPLEHVRIVEIFSDGQQIVIEDNYPVEDYPTSNF